VSAGGSCSLRDETARGKMYKKLKSENLQFASGMRKGKN
jgi:hypothetical protein